MLLNLVVSSYNIYDDRDPGTGLTVFFLRASELYCRVLGSKGRPEPMKRHPTWAYMKKYLSKDKPEGTIRGIQGSAASNSRVSV